jgi:hypothetical protein
MERESLGNLLTFGSVLIFSVIELPYTQNFIVTLEFQCCLSFLRKPFRNANQTSVQPVIGMSEKLGTWFGFSMITLVHRSAEDISE